MTRSTATASSAALKRGGYYSTKKLGVFGADLGAVACFFETPWSRVSTSISEADQAWLLSQAAFRLRALGRLREAVGPMRAGLEIENSGQKTWEGAARRRQPLERARAHPGQGESGRGRRRAVRGLRRPQRRRIRRIV